MRIFIFKSDTNPGLQAFSDDQGGGKLPKQFRPWHAIGVIRRTHQSVRSRSGIGRAADAVGSDPVSVSFR